MTRGLWVGVGLFLAGCASTSKYTPPPEKVPPPFDVNGVQVILDDRRPDWERQPFTGPVSLYHLGKVTPNPWERLAKETEAVVAALPAKPAAVVVTVTSFRLVKKEDSAPPPAKRQPVDTSMGLKTVDNWNTDNFPSKLNYERAKSATENRDPKGASDALNSMAGQKPGQSGPPPLGVHLNPFAADDRPDEFAGHPQGASCSLTAVVQVVFADGREQVVRVKAIAAGQNTSGTAYWGEALDFATKMVVLQFGRQLREGVGLPAE